MLVNINTAVHCAFMLVHSPLTNVNKIGGPKNIILDKGGK